MNNNNMNFQQNFINPYQFNLNNNNNNSIFNQPPFIFNNNINNINNFNNMNYMNDMNNNCNYNNQNQISNNLINNQETIEYHINFKLDHNISYFIIEKNETEVKELLEKFLIKIMTLQYFSFSYIYEIQFLYKEKIIKFNYLFLTIKEYFKDDHNPTIIVNDVNNIFKVYSVTFVVNNGLFIKNYLVNHDRRFGEVLIIFNEDIHEEFPDIKEIKNYLYNNTILDFYKGKTCEKIFKDQYNPIIFLEKDYLFDNQPIIVEFKSINGFKHQIKINKYKTINELLIKFCKETETELGCDIMFLYSCNKLKYNDRTPVGTLFGCDFKPRIIINDINNLIGQINITFEINCEEKYELIIKKGKKMKELLEAFLEEQGFYESFYYENKNDLKILYNEKNIEFSNEKNIGEYFSKDINPKIIIIDKKNLLKSNYNITFQTKNESKIILKANPKNSIKHYIREYINKIDIYPILYHETKFFYNETRINLEDYSLSVEDYFKSDMNPIIIDSNNLLDSKPFNFTFFSFQAINRNKITRMINYGSVVTIDFLLKQYLYTIDHPELINTDEIKFLFNSKYLKFGDETFLDEYFKNEHNPTIFVIYYINFSLRPKKINIVIDINDISLLDRHFCLSVNKGETMEYIFKKFFYCNFIGPELIGNNHIIFIYNAKKINSSQKENEIFGEKDLAKIIMMYDSDIYFSPKNK